MARVTFIQKQKRYPDFHILGENLFFSQNRWESIKKKIFLIYVPNDLEHFFLKNWSSTKMRKSRWIYCTWMNLAGTVSESHNFIIDVFFKKQLKKVKTEDEKLQTWKYHFLSIFCNFWSSYIWIYIE